MASSKRDQPFGVSINLVPLVGALMVLLVFFMIAAPLTRVAIPIDMPISHGEGIQNPVFVSLRADGTIFVDAKTGTVTANWQTLEAAVRQASGGDLTRQIYVRADHEVRYAEVMRLMDMLRGAGFQNSTIVTEDVPD